MWRDDSKERKMKKIWEKRFKLLKKQARNARDKRRRQAKAKRKRIKKRKRLEKEKSEKEQVELEKKLFEKEIAEIILDEVFKVVRYKMNH
jgi:hypothetical protein